MKPTIATIPLAFTAIPSIALSTAAGFEPADPLDRYNVVWSTPSKDSAGSMPLGNGEIGINLWAEKTGDILLYLSRTDAWSENARLLKLGRVRMTLSPNPFGEDAPFRQTLHLRRGEIEIRAGKNDSAVTIAIWVDANQPVVRVEAASRRKFDLQVSAEIWRTGKRTLTGKEVYSAYGLHEGPSPVVITPDAVLPAADNRLAWFHRNATSIWPQTMKLQGMQDWAARAEDPLLNRTFGAIIQGSDLVATNDTTLRSAQPANSFLVSIYPHTAQTPTPAEWLQQLTRQISRTDAADLAAARTAHRRWWDAFWNRSWIRITDTVGGDPTPFIVSRGYTLQRFVTACAGRGNFPIKFNGSLFTVDARDHGQSYDADYRRWGGPYWFQNTRLIYWAMLAAGDFDMAQPLFRMYLDALAMAQARTKFYFEHDGAFFPETMYFWGAYANTNYGWDRKNKHVSHVDNRYIRWEYEGALELLAIMLDYYDCTRQPEFLSGTLLPLARQVMLFYDEHYKRDDGGFLRLEPAQALETYQRVVNPTTDLAGLRWVLDGLLGLPKDAVPPDLRRRWTLLHKQVPSLPTKRENNRVRLLPAKQILEKPRNSENPELYAVFPFRLYGVGKPDLDVGRYTFEKRRFPGHNGWRQDDIQAALLGLTTQAASYVTRRFASKNPQSRFPAFWGPNFDWIPDQDHGCVGTIALQRMLIQTNGEKILLFPAWPKRWDVDFKLYAPRNTVLEGRYQAGKLQRLSVTPPERANDVVKMDPR